MNTQNNKFFHRVQHLPLACSGLALGISGYASLIDVILQKYIGAEKNNIWIFSSILIPIAILLITLLTFKYVRHTKIMKFEMKDPLFSSFLPTYSMVLMCIAGYVAGWEKGNGWIAVNQVFGAIIMCAALTMQIVLLVFFIKEVLLRHSWNLNPVYGSWFVPSVGMATATTFANRFSQLILPDEFFQGIWYFTFVWYIVLLIPLTYSMLFKTKVPSDKLASTAVYFAPANLTMAGFLQTFSLNERANAIYLGSNFIPGMSICLWAFGFSMMIILIIFSIKILFKTKFSFLFASLTFPLSISAAGAEYMTLYLSSLKLEHQLIYTFWQVAGTLSIAFSIIVTLVMLYIVPIFIYKVGEILFTKKYDDKCHCVYEESKQEVEIKNAI
ncbi:MAG: hypothetical protein K2L64_03855 [Ureaplasma sp.]|nr:hypothetical protein [Ureaplasma sp.]